MRRESHVGTTHLTPRDAQAIGRCVGRGDAGGLRAPGAPQEAPVAAPTAQTGATPAPVSTNPPPAKKPQGKVVIFDDVKEITEDQR